jgi:CTP:phosphocholine cytidylyltransferase-like protein
MTYVIRMGSSYRMMSEQDIEVCEKLPAKNYTVKQNPMSKEYYLEPVDDFVMPNKLYGDTIKKAERILNTFRSRPLSTGVHLDGVKGSGKTLLAKTLSHMAQKDGVASIVINQPFCGDEFNSFVQSIDVPAILIFDEFEKVYDYQTQNKILTLFDGVYPTKKLFVLTTNDAHSVNSFLKNRPGRIYYSFKFDTLAQEFIEEYCNDNLIDKSQTQSVLKYTSIFSFFNFDMLAAAVEEMNRYGEPLQEVLNYLNIVPENKASETYVVRFTVGDFTKTLEKNYRGFSPNNFDYYVDMEDELKELKDHDKKMYALLEKNFAEADYDESKDIHYDPSKLVSFDALSNTFTYTIERGGVEANLTVERVVNISTDFKKYGVLF